MSWRMIKVMQNKLVCVWKLRSNFYSLEKSVSPPTDLQSQISMNSRSDSLLFEYIEFFFFFFSTFVDLAYDQILCLPHLFAAFCFAH